MIRATACAVSPGTQQIGFGLITSLIFTKNLLVLALGLYLNLDLVDNRSVARM